VGTASDGRGKKRGCGELGKGGGSGGCGGGGEKGERLPKKKGTKTITEQLKVKFALNGEKEYHLK